MKRTKLQQETDEMRNRPVVKRCENWGKCLRLYVPGWDESAPIGGGLRSLEASHQSERYRVLTPNPTVLLDVVDAKIIESAAAALMLYPHALLKAWYVRSFSPGKCLTYAAEAAGVARVRFQDFDAHLEAAHTLLLAALELPAVVRKERARALVREILSRPLATAET